MPTFHLFVDLEHDPFHAYLLCVCGDALLMSGGATHDTNQTIMESLAHPVFAAAVLANLYVYDRMRMMWCVDYGCSVTCPGVRGQ